MAVEVDEPVVVVENQSEVRRVNAEEGEEEMNKNEERKRGRDLEKGEDIGELKEKVTLEKKINNINGFDNEEQGRDFHLSMMQRLNPTNPLRVVLNNNNGGSSRISTPPQPFQPRFTPTPTSQPSITTLNSRRYTNKISLVLFLLCQSMGVGLVCFLVFKGIQGLIVGSKEIRRKERRVLVHFLPQVEVASLLSITLAFVWQKTLRVWPQFMVHFIVWSCFIMSLSTGILLICFQKPPTDGVGVCLILFSISNGLYACWITPRIKFCSKILIKSLEPVSKFPDLNHPTYLTLGVGFIYMSVWILAVIGSLNFYYPALTVLALVLSLAWTTEVMRNVVNLTVSRVIALYYLRGMQSSTKFCFQRALTLNLGSACLGSLFVPAIEALRIISRVLNLLKGHDEFMFCCAHCCLRVMDSIFTYGNGWAYVQTAVYGKGFVQASQDTWELFKKQEMETVVDSDITSSICFLSGCCSGCICALVVAAWTSREYEPYTATITLLAFFVGYLMTRISMAVPHACISCYYVCYAENPENRLFDKTIKDRINLIKSGRDDVVVPTPRVPRRFNL